MLLDFYFLLSLMLGARISFHVLNYFSQRDNHNGKRKVLIYGASVKGALISQQIINEESLNLFPIGFLDEDPQLEGKRLNGYPIFGGHWKLERLLQTTDVKEILICTDSLKDEVMRRLERIARSKRITLWKLKVHLEEASASEITIYSSQERLVFVEK